MPIRDFEENIATMLCQFRMLQMERCVKVPESAHVLACVRSTVDETPQTVSSSTTPWTSKRQVSGVPQNTMLRKNTTKLTVLPPVWPPCLHHSRSPTPSLPRRQSRQPCPGWRCPPPQAPRGQCTASCPRCETRQRGGAIAKHGATRRPGNERKTPVRANTNHIQLVNSCVSGVQRMQRAETRHRGHGLGVQATQQTHDTTQREHGPGVDISSDEKRLLGSGHPSVNVGQTALGKKPYSYAMSHVAANRYSREGGGRVPVVRGAEVSRPPAHVASLQIHVVHLHVAPLAGPKL